MKYVPKQCKVCPFRKTSAQGWLGNYTAATVFSSIWEGIPFFCHDSMDYTKKGCIEEAVSNPRKGKLCVGGLVFADKIHAPERTAKYPIILVARAKVRLRKDIECMEPREFIDHHPDWQAKAEEKDAERRKKKEASATTPKNKEGKDPGKCFNCEEETTSDNFCFGCKVYVCEDCSKNLNVPWGGHDPEVHLEEAEEDE